MALRSDKVRFDPAEPATATLFVRAESVQGTPPSIELSGDALDKPRTIAPAALDDDPGVFRVPFGPLPEGRYLAKIIGGTTEATAVFDVAAASGGQILSGVELALAPRAGNSLTADLGDLAVAKANQVAAGAPVARAIPGRPALRAAGVAGLAALAILLLAVGAPRLFWSQWQRFIDPFGEHVPFARIQIHVEPGDVTVVYGASLDIRATPPAYTNRPAWEGPLPQGGLALLPRTKVQVRARSNRPLSAGTLRYQAGDTTFTRTLAPTSPQAEEVTGEFEVRVAGKLDVQLTDTAGQSSTDVFTAPVVLLRDERPALRLVEPPPLAFATPTVLLPVLLAAEDDYGLSRLQVFRSLNDSRALPLDVKLPAPAPLRWSAPLRLPLAEYGLQPGDEIKLFGRVADTDPDGPNGAESAVAVIKIISQEEYEKMVLARQALEAMISRYRQAQRRTDKLVDEIERLRKKTKELSKADAERLRSLADQERPQDVAVVRRFSDGKTQQEALRQGLLRLLDDIEDHLAQLPDDPDFGPLREDATEFLKLARGIGAIEAMLEAEKGLGDLSGQRGHAGAKTAAELLEKLLKQGDDFAGGAPGRNAGRWIARFAPTLHKRLGDTIAQMLAGRGLFPGQGQGSQGSQQALDSVGLYGGLQDFEAPRASRGDRAGKGTGQGPGATIKSSRPGGTPALTLPAPGAAAEAAVPSVYRRRVADYFQRVAEEVAK